MRTLPLSLICFTIAAAVGTPDTAIARPKALPLFEPGQAPSRPMEILKEMTLEVSDEASQAAAVEQLRKQAKRLGADAVLDVVVVEMKKDVPLAQLAAVPVVMLGSLISIMAMNPTPLQDTVAAVKDRQVKQKVRVVKGVAVKYLH